MLGGAAPAHILEIDLPQRQTLVPGSPAASVGPGDRQRGEMGKDVLTSRAGAPRMWRVCFLRSGCVSEV